MPEGMLAARGVSIEDMVELINAGYATAIAERVRAGDRQIGGRRRADHRRGSEGDRAGRADRIKAVGIPARL